MRVSQIWLSLALKFRGTFDRPAQRILIDSQIHMCLSNSTRLHDIFAARKMDIVALLPGEWNTFPSVVDGLTIVAVWMVFIMIWTWYGHGLHRVPGPFFASISSFWKWNIIRKEEMPWRNTLLHQKYGPLVRIGPNHISASSPEAMRAIHIDKRGLKKVHISLSGNNSCQLVPLKVYANKNSHQCMIFCNHHLTVRHYIIFSLHKTRNTTVC